MAITMWVTLVVQRLIQSLFLVLIQLIFLLVELLIQLRIKVAVKVSKVVVIHRICCRHLSFLYHVVVGIGEQLARALHHHLANGGGLHLPARAPCTPRSQLARALAHLHEHNVLHMDVNPASCFVTFSRIAKMHLRRCCI